VGFDLTTHKLQAGKEIDIYTYLNPRPLCSTCGTIHAGLPDGIFQTKNPKLGKFRRVLQQKMLGYFMAIWSILVPFGIFCSTLVKFCGHLVYFSRFGMLYQEKSGNPGS
jgi:hypothetical protein